MRLQTIDWRWMGMNVFVRAAMLFLGLAIFSGCAMWRAYMEKEYKRLLEMPDAVHQPMACMPEINRLDADACVYLNLCLRHMRAVITESDYHRVGVGFENDIQTIVKEDGVDYAVAFAKVKHLIIREDATRPDGEKVWPTVEAWVAAKKEVEEVETRRMGLGSAIRDRLNVMSERLSEESSKLQDEMKRVPLKQRNTEYYKSLRARLERVLQNQTCLGIVNLRLADCGACSMVELEASRRELVLKYYRK